MTGNKEIAVAVVERVGETKHVLVGTVWETSGNPNLKLTSFGSLELKA